MTNNRKYNMFGWLATTALLLTTACSDNAILEAPKGSLSGSNIVTFTIQPQQVALGTRAEGNSNVSISQGQEADVLIFAVYKATEITANDTVWTLTDDFCKPSQATIKGSNGTPFIVAKEQNAINVDFSDGKKVTLQFAISDEKAIYKAAFWAQSSQTKAYDTSNLEQVKVNYKTPASTETAATADDDDYLNNDELRDAFCSVSAPFTAEDKTREVVLRRPLAQINVGTAGWDYEGAAYLKPSSVSYVKSQITLDGVAQYYNILTGKALDQAALDKALEQNVGDENYENATTTAVFTFNRIPAFINSTEAEWTKTYKPLEGKEEYLKVHVDKNEDTDKDTHKDYYPYVGWEQYEEYRQGTIGGKYSYTKEDDTKTKFLNGEHPDTETFKYLSMCYVLVPEESDLTNLTPSEDSNIKDLQLGAVLNSVKFEAKGIEYKDATVTTPSPEEEDVPAETEDAATEEDDEFKKEFTINNVPVQKNWRTNILGYNFFVTTQKFMLDIVPEYFGDYNRVGEPSGEWDGVTEIKGGTYSVSFRSPWNPKESEAGYFTYGDKKTPIPLADCKYNGDVYNCGYKMEGTSAISFTTWTPSTITIVQSTANDSENRNWAGIKLDGEEYTYKNEEATEPKDANNSNVRVYTIKGVSAGQHKISRGDYPADSSDEKFKTNNSKQAYILYVEVKTEDGVLDNIEDKDNKYEHPDENN